MAPLTWPAGCPACGAENPAGQKYCGSCGRRLGAGAPRSEVKPETPEHLARKIRAAGAALAGERKHVSVLFADVQGSMDIAASLDAEEWRAIMNRFVAILSDGVYRFEGAVDKFTGDGIMALFGAPIAHEDHARRACYASLHLAGELARYAAELRRTRGVNFSVRMGINSGEVVLGTIGGDLRVDYTAVGHTVGLAQRMEGLAEPGKTYLTEHTAALVEGYFELRDLGRFDIRGVRESMRVYELAGAGTLRTRLEVSAARGFSRFVGREAEMAALKSELGRALEGEGRAVALVGEAGVGKSRLCHELLSSCRRQGVEVWEAHALAHARDVPFLPVLELMRTYFGITERDEPRTVRDKIAGRLLMLDDSLRDVLPFLFDFLGVPDPERPAPRLDPEAGQRQLRRALGGVIRARGRLAPTVVLVEDLQWLDAGSEAMVARLVANVPGTRALVILTYRSDYRADWLEQARCAQLPLSPLGGAAIDLLVADLLGSDPSLADLTTVIRERTGGNPLFVEEVVRTLAEAGTLVGTRNAYRLAGAVATVTIPPTVQAVLAARIDRLDATAKSVLETAAVAGGAFSAPVLGRVSGLDEEQLAMALDALVDADLIDEEELYPEARYAFRHALAEEVAYRSLLSSRRAATHHAVAHAIEELYPERLDELSALLAHHYGAAGEHLEAASWSARAAAWAGFKDPFEAMRHWRRVRELTLSLDETLETVVLGISARWMILNFAWRLGPAEGQDLGAFETEMAEVFSEGRSLAERHEQTALLVWLLSAYGSVQLLTGHLEDSAALGREALEVAQRTGDRGLQVIVVTPLVYTLFLLGRLHEALDVVKDARALAGHDRSLAANTAIVSPYAWMLMMQGLLVACTGDLPESKRGLDEALAAARDGNDFETEAWTHMMLVTHCELAQDDASALAHAHQAVELAERAGGAFSRGLAQQYLGVAHVLRGEWDEAVRALERARALHGESEVGWEEEPMVVAMLARARLGRGDVAAARALADEAIQLATALHTQIWEIHARHQRAGAALAGDEPDGLGVAETELRRALALAASTGAQAFEPRLHLSLAEVAERRGDEGARDREEAEGERLRAKIGG